MTDILRNNKVDQGELLTLLRKRLVLDRAIFENRKASMSELEKAEQELKLSKTEFQIVTLENGLYSERKSAKYDEIVTEFLNWEPTHAREAINFLVSEFFSGAYQNADWDKEFITDLMFEVTRVLSLIDQLERARS